MVLTRYGCETAVCGLRVYNDTFGFARQPEWRVPVRLTAHVTAVIILLSQTHAHVLLSLTAAAVSFGSNGSTASRVPRSFTHRPSATLVLALGALDGGGEQIASSRASMGDL